MKERTIGDLIYRSRVDRNITQKQLCDGLCSVQTLSKIESGERMPDVFLLEYLLQRLGLSSDDLEIVLFEDEFREVELRDSIEEKIQNREFGEATKLIEILPHPNASGIRMQYYHQMKAVLESAEERYTQAIVHIESALQYTGKERGYIGEISSIYGTKEIQLLCMMAQVYLLKGAPKKAKRILKEVILYLEHSTISDKELVKTFPKAVVLMAEVLEDKKERMEQVSRCEKAFSLLINRDSLVFLPEIMKLLIQYYTEMKLSNKALRLEKQLKVLEELSQDLGHNLYMRQNPLGWFAECSRQEYLLCEEMIRGEREAQRMPRGALIEGIYEDLETLVRIENGNQSLSYKKYAQLMERLHRPTQKYIGPPLWDDDLILIAKEKIGKSLIQHEYEEAREEIEKLKLLVEDNDCLNKQYIEKEEAYLEFKMNHINVETFVKRIEEVLKITYSEQIEEVTRIPTLDECYIFNYLLLGYRKNNMEENAIKLYKKLLESYKRSKIREKYHYRELTILHRNYITLLEEMNCTKSAQCLAEEGIKYELQAHRGKGLDYICTELMCIFEKMNLEEDKKQVEKYLRLAFYLSDLFDRKNNNRIIDDYYKSHIDSNVQWYV